MGKLSVYTSENQYVSLPGKAIYDVLSDLSNLKYLGDRFKEYEPDYDSNRLSFKTPVGRVTFFLHKAEPYSAIEFHAEKAALPVGDVILCINLNEESPDRTCINAVLGIDIPAFAKPLLIPRMQGAADGIANMLASLPYTDILENNSRI